MKNPTQTEIACELGISKAALSKLKKAGMPVYSADAARRWRATHLHSGRMRDDPGPSPRTLVERATALLPLAREALRAERFHLVAGELRAALRAIPTSHRSKLVMDFEVWEAMIGPETCAEMRDDVARNPLPETDASGAEDHDGVGEVFAVMYSLACGEARWKA